MFAKRFCFVCKAEGVNFYCISIIMNCIMDRLDNINTVNVFVVLCYKLDSHRPPFRLRQKRAQGIVLGHSLMFDEKKNDHN